MRVMTPTGDAAVSTEPARERLARGKGRELLALRRGSPAGLLTTPTVRAVVPPQSARVPIACSESHRSGLSSDSGRRPAVPLGPLVSVTARLAVSANAVGAGEASAVAVGDGSAVGVDDVVGVLVASGVAVGDGSGGAVTLVAIGEGVSGGRLAVAAASGVAGVTVASGDSQAPLTASRAASRQRTSPCLTIRRAPRRPRRHGALTVSRPRAVARGRRRTPTSRRRRPRCPRSPAARARARRWRRRCRRHST